MENPELKIFTIHREAAIKEDTSTYEAVPPDPSLAPISGIFTIHREAVVKEDDSAYEAVPPDPSLAPISGIFILQREMVITSSVKKKIKKFGFTAKALNTSELEGSKNNFNFTAFDPSEDI